MNGLVMGGRKRGKKTKVRVAHELPKRRKMVIQEAMDAHKSENRQEWGANGET